MADYNCNACADLRDDAPNLIVNGLTSTECASLKNNTGLNPSSGNNDCTDLDNMNDCLIGNLEDEIDAYDVCEWKDFTKKYIDNVWTVIKGIICAICGIWTNIKNLWTKVNSFDDKINSMCEIVEQMITPNVPIWGILPLATSEMQARRCGTATNKVVAEPNGGDAPASLKPNQNIGLYYLKKTVTSCRSGNEQVIEWIAPHTYMYDLKSGAESGDILWKITKSEAQSKLGISDYLWNIFVVDSWTWTDVRLTDRQMAWLRLTAAKDGLGANELGIIFMGCTAPNDAISSDERMAALGAERCKVFRHNA